MGRYSGKLELVSDAVVNTLIGIGTIHAVRVGDEVLRNMRTDPSLHALLVPGEEVELGTGRLLWWCWLLRLDSRGQTHRHGLFSFVFGNVVHAIVGGTVIGIAAALVIQSQSQQANVAVLGGIALFALNLKAWWR